MRSFLFLMSMRRLVLLLGALAAFSPLTTFAAVQGSLLIEQVSPSELGAWTLTAANGTQWTSADPKVSPKKFSLSIADVGLLTFKVTATTGASAKIVIYRRDELVKEEMSNQ